MLICNMKKLKKKNFLKFMISFHDQILKLNTNSLKKDLENQLQKNYMKYNNYTNKS